MQMLEVIAINQDVSMDEIQRRLNGMLVPRAPDVNRANGKNRRKRKADTAVRMTRQQCEANASLSQGPVELNRALLRGDEHSLADLYAWTKVKT